MAINLQEYGLLIEDISDMSFRNEAHIKLDKAKREKAFTQTVDIIVESISFSQYENFKSNPPIQFYGYVELVFQDALSLEIPIHFPRQRLYQAYQWEALRQWNEYLPFLASRQYHANTYVQLDAIKAALEIPETVRIEAELWETKWIELPLREIHVRLEKESQFSISYAQYQPVPFDDPLSPIPKIRDGKSNQTDGAKDNGLPSNGIQPSKRSPSNPFGGNRPISSPSDLANKGFINLNPSNLNTPNPSNAPLPGDPFSDGASICSLNVFGQCSPSGQGNYSLNYANIRVPAGDSFNVTSRPNDGAFTGGVIVNNAPNVLVNGIILSPSGLFFNADTNLLQDSFYSFSQCQMTLTASCVHQ